MTQFTQKNLAAQAWRFEAAQPALQNREVPLGPNPMTRQQRRERGEEAGQTRVQRTALTKVTVSCSHRSSPCAPFNTLVEEVHELRHSSLSNGTKRALQLQYWDPRFHLPGGAYIPFALPDIYGRLGDLCRRSYIGVCRGSVCMIV